MQANTKKEVSCKVLDTIFSYAKQKNILIDSLLVDVPYDLPYLLNKQERIEWWVWCKIIYNSRKYFQPYEYEEMGRSFVSRGTYWEGILWSFFLFTSSRFTRILYTQIFKLAASTFSCIRHQTEFKESNGFITTAYMEEGYEFSPEWASMCKGVWEQLGANIGQKDFRVNTTITNEKVIFDVSWKKESIIFKIKTGFKWIFNIKKALVEISDSRDAILNQYQKLEASQIKLQKQTTQLKVAYEISTSIHQSLNISNTLKAIADSFVKEAGFTAVYIELEKDLEGNTFKKKFQSGAIKNFTPPAHREIIINGKKIGDILAFSQQGTDNKEVDELLDYITPVINIAIHDALTLRDVTKYKDNLEKMVDKRTFELQKARDELADTNELLKEAQHAQNRFFTNISHEFRTPLTLILGPAKRIMEKSIDEESKSDADFIQRNAKKLNKLVDELLDISKIESGEMKLRACPVNIVTSVKEIALSFSSLAERKKIAFRINSDEEEITAYIDKNKFDKILSNVLSNAFKFTPEGGRVELGVELIGSRRLQTAEMSKSRNLKGATTGVKKMDSVEISVHDTGIGIPKDQLDKIFDRFYQVDGSHTRQHGGTGIGLALTKELVELHKGKIEVESKEGKGTTFRIFFPLGKEHLRPEEIFKSEADIIEGKSIFTEFEELIENHFEKQIEDKLSEKLTLLIVEDNTDVRKYVETILGSQYKIYEATDGEEGLTKALEYIPDIIISDIMMPKMDGFQLCSKLKSDSRTSHIPIIMLTAKATMEDRISGFETGADMYIMKPFEAEELKARIKNLIEQRKRLHEHFQKFGLAELDKKNITSVDQKFLGKVLTVIDEHLSDTSFGVESLAENMSVSRSLLFRKLEALTGESPVELIRRTRLNKAAIMIKKNSDNISQIALEVGFNNPSYFTECFKKQFGITPSQYHDKRTS